YMDEYFGADSPLLGMLFPEVGWLDPAIENRNAVLLQANDLAHALQDVAAQLRDGSVPAEQLAPALEGLDEFGQQLVDAAAEASNHATGRASDVAAAADRLARGGWEAAADTPFAQRLSVVGPPVRLLAEKAWQLHDWADSAVAAVRGAVGELGPEVDLATRTRAAERLELFARELTAAGIDHAAETERVIDAVRQLLDDAGPDALTASAVPRSVVFGGGVVRPGGPDAAAVLVEASRVVAERSGQFGASVVTDADGGRRVRFDAGGDLVPLTSGPLAPVVETVVDPDGTVRRVARKVYVQTQYGPDGNPTRITVAHDATDAAVERGLVHEFAEIAAVAAGHENNQGAMLRAGVPVAREWGDVTAQFVGRLAELEHVVSAGDAVETAALAVHMGLLANMPGAGELRALVEAQRPGLVAGMDQLALDGLVDLSRVALEKGSLTVEGALRSWALHRDGEARFLGRSAAWVTDQAEWLDDMAAGVAQRLDQALQSPPGADVAVSLETAAAAILDDIARQDTRRAASWHQERDRMLSLGRQVRESSEELGRLAGVAVDLIGQTGGPAAVEASLADVLTRWSAERDTDASGPQGVNLWAQAAENRLGRAWANLSERLPAVVSLARSGADRAQVEAAVSEALGPLRELGAEWRQFAGFFADQAAQARAGAERLTALADRPVGGPAVTRQALVEQSTASAHEASPWQSTPVEAPADGAAARAAVDTARELAVAGRSDEGQLDQTVVERFLDAVPDISLRGTRGQHLAGDLATLADLAATSLGLDQVTVRPQGPAAYLVEDADGAPVAVVKVFDQIAELVSELSAFERVSRPEFTAFTVPDPLAVAVADARGVLVMSVAPGHSIRQLMDEAIALSGAERAVAMDRVRRAVAAAATAMAELHTRASVSPHARSTRPAVA
ncbi:MAG TPA: hypothetical protein VGR21_01440, partial [Cryptosporangiaceae bacterium]|nr:hypothetical protein [Cryptosporangiaceae bacterium]